MDSVLLESPAEPKPRAFVPLTGPIYEPMLRESIDRFLAELQRGARDFSGLRIVLSRLLQSSPDPPLGAVWLYSAIAFHEALVSKTDGLDRVLAVRDLLQLLVACSASSPGPKSIALLAPVLSELHKSLLEAEKNSDSRTKREIELLVEGIVGYISICCSKDSRGCEAFSPSSDGSLRCFSELVRVWVARHGNLGVDGRGLGVFFPLVSDEMRDGFRMEGCELGYLAGVVITEAFLLRLCLKVQAGGVSRPKLQTELRIWAVSSVTVFRDRVFFEILLRLLLEPTLPVISILIAKAIPDLKIWMIQNSKDENVVRDVLYDAVILVEYSFLNFESELEQSYDCMTSLAITRLIVTHEAIRIARARGDQDKAISYMNAFSTSSIPNKLIKLVSGQVGMVQLNRPSATTPHALLKWLVNLEEQGMRLFGDCMSKLRGKLIFDDLKTLHEVAMVNPNSNRTDADLFFFDKQGQVAEDAVGNEEMESMDGAFQAAARSMKPVASNGRRKRGEYGDEGETQVKLVKYKIHDNSVKDYFSISVTDGMNSGSEVGNPLSDDEMEEIEH